MAFRWAHLVRSTGQLFRPTVRLWTICELNKLKWTKMPDKALTSSCGRDWLVWTTQAVYGLGRLIWIRQADVD
jgi:hypothetical protein